MGKAFEASEKERIRDRLIEEGIRHFSEAPYEGVKIEAIAKAIGIGKGTFYRFFETKEALFVACTMSFEASCQSMLLDRLSAEKTSIERIKIAIEMMLVMIREDAFMRRLIEAKGIDILALARTEHDRNAMLSVDIDMIRALLGDDVRLKVPEAVAVELLRSLFYLAVINPPLEIEASVYYDYLLKGIMHQIVEVI